MKSDQPVSPDINWVVLAPSLTVICFVVSFVVVLSIAIVGGISIVVVVDGAVHTHVTVVIAAPSCGPSQQTLKWVLHLVCSLAISHCLV